ncbi:hypothetical protein JHK84_047716 [Glycine max]|nr:hypothetical protein JHK86_047693 [Glycine max]KAG4943663.1 hypothetical protein JHK85_048309 [Glycine max]KAG5102747.1 hypothetical protein JHK84_047716 [Glycine max]
MTPRNEIVAIVALVEQVSLSLLFTADNAGFDPVVIRNDGYCNVLYYHADSASPVA